MILRKWEVRPLDKERAAAFAQTYGVPFFLAMLMNIRGLDDAAHLREFLGEGEPLSDPFLLKDMDKAAARITRAVDNMEKIAVYGDYDADGVTSTAMLYSYLETRGADVIFYIPQREGEGYGMNIGAVEYLKEQGVSLIVTVDNGISSVQEVARANELGIPGKCGVRMALQILPHHPIADKNGALSRHILRLHPLRKLVGNHQRDRTVFYHGGDNLFGQMLLRRQGLRPSGLSDVVGFGDGGADPSGSILFGIFLIRIEGISFLTGTDGAPGFLPFVEGAGMGDFRILRIEKQQVAGFLRGAVRHEMEESPQGIVILEH